MEAKKLISKLDKEKKIHFKPEPPIQLLRLADDQYKNLDRARNDLSNLMPELTSNYILSVERPVISTFEGIEGIKKVFEDIYSPKAEPVIGCVDFEIADKAVPDYINNKLIPLRMRNKVKAQAFIAKSPMAEMVHKKDADSLRESVILDKKEYPLPAEIDVYDDKVAMLSFSQGKFVGVLIQNQDIATSFKSIFRLALRLKQTEEQKLNS